MSNGRKAVVAIFVVCFIVVVAILYSIIYVTPRMDGIGKDTVIVEYAEFPVQDAVTGIFVREETLYTAAYAGAPQYMVEEGTKVRAGTQVVYIDSSVPPPQAETEMADGDIDAEPAPTGMGSSGESEETVGITIPTMEQIRQASAGTSVASEGGVSPSTAIVSYYADGYEKRINPDSIDTLNIGLLSTLPDYALDLERSWTNAGEPVYKITNNNIWRFVFWLPDTIKDAEKRYVPGVEVTLDLGTTKVMAVIESVEKQRNDYFIVLRSDMYYRDLDKYRKQNVNVVFNVYHGAVINEDSVSERAGVPGVYVRQQSGTFKWIPIRILRESEGRILVAETSYEDAIGGRVSTVRFYDEIMKDPAAEGY